MQRQNNGATFAKEKADYQGLLYLASMTGVSAQSTSMIENEDDKVESYFDNLLPDSITVHKQMNNIQPVIFRNFTQTNIH